MRHADFTTAPLAAATPTAPTRPTPSIDNGTGFGRAFSQVQDEVADFIKNGGGGFEVHRLTPAAQALRAQTQQVVASVGAGEPTANQQAFLDAIAPWAQEAADKLGVSPELVSAHAALESGWGQRPLRNADGSSSYNLFGMKAGQSWNGAVAEDTTTEYVHGAAVKTSAKFRAYPDQASAFRDYAQMLLENPRFRGALGAGSDARAFAQGLARGGYATDPNYAAKLQSVAARFAGVNG